MLNLDLVELVHHPKFRFMQRFWLGLLRFYFRPEVEGLENIPKSGRALICPNHSGFVGADAVILTHLIRQRTKRRARILAHRAFFDFSATLKQVSESFGMKKASVENGVTILKQDHLLMLFPEGETGNFKSTYRRYRLQKFHTGFLRMAIEAQAPIIPCVIVGAEESNLNLGSIDLSAFVRKLRIPLPVNIVPLPAKWRIRFLRPVDVSRFSPGILENPQELERVARRIQRELQREIFATLRQREYIYFRPTRRLLNRVVSATKKIKSA